ncbi:MAG: molybdopterin molybdotransferase MoeA [Coriobacteriia bacterium]|nr:molybdopterin molybdotransferase MoeA [Coriobacteriia bacterium]
MITVEEATEQVLSRISVLEPERVPLLDALGRVLAEDVVSDIDIAPFDNSAMDGYAVRHADVVGARDDAPVTLKVVDHIPAGVAPERAVGPGEASRIMTGAPVPLGADTIVMVERTRAGEGEGRVGGTVQILEAAKAGEHVRRRGEEVRAGEVVLLAGDEVGPAAIGLAASVGHAELVVHRRPQVAIVSTGDELVDVTEKPGPGKIRNSNSYSLAAQVMEAGGDPHVLGVALDNEEHTRALLFRAPEFDLMITTGGVSMGDFDVVKKVLTEIGELDFWKVAMRPGAPQTFGTIGGTPFFGLPGNPTSTMVGFEMYVRPAMRKMAGFCTLARPRVVATLEHDVEKKADRRYFLRARLTPCEEGYSVAISGNQSSALLTAMHRANCLMSLPEGEFFVPAGTEVICIRLDMEEGTP